jgi:protein-disulfide isomerase
LKTDYVDTGKIKFLYRHYPLTAIHPNAMKAAIASECANDQDKFWEYHDKLFTSQDEWASLAAQAASDKLKEYAAGLGLNAGNFNSCLDSDKFKDKVDEDLADGTKAGVNGTPATFVNGILISGAVPYDQFKTQIDSALAK